MVDIFLEFALKKPNLWRSGKSWAKRGDYRWDVEVYIFLLSTRQGRGWLVEFSSRWFFLPVDKWWRVWELGRRLYAVSTAIKILFSTRVFDVCELGDYIPRRDESRMATGSCVCVNVGPIPYHIMWNPMCSPLCIPSTQDEWRKLNNTICCISYSYGNCFFFTLFFDMKTAELNATEKESKKKRVPTLQIENTDCHCCSIIGIWDEMKNGSFLK